MNTIIATEISIEHQNKDCKLLTTKYRHGKQISADGAA